MTIKIGHSVIIKEKWDSEPLSIPAFKIKYGYIYWNV